ncbi:MAG: hypothetical protein RLZ63_303 [Pseudomonadota bacterium]|jgi:diguanylate cyclase (GGDEF)-like protein
MNAKSYRHLTQWFAVLAIAACLVIYLGWRTTQRFTDVTAHQVQLIQTAESIRLLQSEIDTATRMITYTGDIDWGKQGTDAYRKLSLAVHTSAQLLAEEEIDISRIETASAQLITTEQQAMELIRQNKTRPASGLLLSSTYLENKHIFNESLSELSKRLNDHQQALKDTFERETRFVSLTMVALILMISYIVYRMYKIMDRLLRLQAVQSQIAKRLSMTNTRPQDEPIEWALEQLANQFGASSVWLCYREQGPSPHLIRSWFYCQTALDPATTASITKALHHAREDSHGHMQLETAHKTAGHIQAFEAATIHLPDQYEYMLAMLSTHGQKPHWSDEDWYVLQGVCESLTHTLERRKQILELEKFASLDGLTGLFNRRQFDALFEREREHCLQSPLTSALLMLDIDWFKKVNDQYGHAVGDEVLIKLAGLMKQYLRKNDIAGRVGGEEFAVILPSSTAEQAMETADRLRHHVEVTPIPTDAGDLRITISIGVTLFRRDDTAITEILKRADDAMYASKQCGRNRVTLG